MNRDSGERSINQDSAATTESRCVYRTCFGPIHKLTWLERWLTPQGVEYRLVEAARVR